MGSLEVTVEIHAAAFAQGRKAAPAPFIIEGAGRVFSTLRPDDKILGAMQPA